MRTACRRLATSIPTSTRYLKPRRHLNSATVTNLAAGVSGVRFHSASTNAAVREDGLHHSSQAQEHFRLNITGSAERHGLSHIYHEESLPSRPIHIPHVAQRLTSHIIKETGREVTVAWHANVLLLVDEATQTGYEYHAEQLRDGCQCSQCVDRSSGQKSFASSQVPPGIKIKHAESTAQGLIIFTDGDLSQSKSNQHEVTLPWQWVERLFPGSPEQTTPRMAQLRRRFGIEHWDAEIIANQVRKIDYHEYMKGQEALWDVVQDLVRFGLVFLKNVPRDENSIVDITTRLANIRETFYGRTFDVRAKPDAENVAYTSGYLGLHQDLLYLSPPPQIQILHCMDNSCQGGDSLFSDADRVGRMMWHMRGQEIIDDLVRVQVPYGYDRNGYLYGRQRGLLSSDSANPSTYGGVFWSPPFQKQFRYPFDMRRWIKGARIFETLVNEEKAMYQTKMASGDAVLFDNMRVLHGRTAFDVAGGGSRWLRGAYISPEDFASRASYATDAYARGMKNPDQLWSPSKAEQELAETKWYADLQERVQQAQQEFRYGS